MLLSLTVKISHGTGGNEGPLAVEHGQASAVGPQGSHETSPFMELPVSYLLNEDGSTKVSRPRASTKLHVAGICVFQGSAPSLGFCCGLSLRFSGLIYLCQGLRQCAPCTRRPLNHQGL